MKKTLIALAAVAATGAAFAQSSVTIFGAVDLSISNVKNGSAGSQTTMAPSGVNSSALGFRGVEDLGGGMSAEFHLETDLNPDVGTQGTGFNRRSTLGLKGGFGEIRLGRDYTPTFWNHSNFTAFGTNGIGRSTATLTTAAVTSILGSGATTTVRSDNAISYFSPNFSGFSVHAMVGLKESADANTPNEYTGVRLVYNQGPLFASLATASEGSSTQTANLKRTNFGVAYDFGVARALLFRMDAKFGAAKLSQTGIGVTAPVGPGTLKAQYIKSDENAAAGNKDASHFAIGYDYPLSKRTAVYVHAATLDNKAGATYTLGAGSNATAIPAGQTSSGYQVGIRHTF